MFTRKQYLNKECSHREYYAQFTDAAIKSRVLQWIGIERVKTSTDPHFNDINLTLWDQLSVPVTAQAAKLMRSVGDYPTLAGAVCIAKEAAQQIKEEA